MKSFIISTLFLVAVIAGVVFALTSNASIPEPEAYVVSFEGNVQIQKRDSDSWRDVEKDEVLVQGDKIKTGEDGELIINFYNQSVSRIGPNSEIEIEELTESKVGLKVAVGRVWSRIIQLLDKESEFEIESNKTVATVRGTIFNFGVDAENIASVSTIEGKVSVAVIEGGRVDLPAGKEVIIDQKKELSELMELEVQIIPDEKKESEWFRENMEMKEEFEGYIEDGKKDMLGAVTGLLPESKLLYSAKRLAEEARLAVTSDAVKKSELEDAFALRRAVELEYLDETGQKNLDEESEKRLEGIVEKLLSGGEINQEDKMWLEFGLQNHFYFQKVVVIELESEEELEAVKEELQSGNLDVLEATTSRSVEIIEVQ